MKLILKTRPPGSFTKYIHEIGASFADIDKNVREDLQKALLNEQGWVCGYCEQKITDFSTMQIEHHCEQTICDGKNGTTNRTLDYTNLLAVCKGKGVNGVLHCDSNKSRFSQNTGLPIDFSPWNSAHVTAIKYHSTGLLESTISRHNDELNKILNLNEKYLKDARRNLWTSIFKSIKTGSPAFKRAKIRRLTEPRCNIVGEKYESSFPGLYAYLLKKFG